MNPLRYSDAAAIVKRMGTGAHEAVILTNKPSAKKMLEACSSPVPAHETGGTVYTVTARAITAAQTTPARLIGHDTRIAEQVKQIRARPRAPSPA